MKLDLDKAQKDIIQNKKDHGWQVKIPEEFCYLYGEVAEAYDAYLKGKEDLGLELADVAIYLLSIAETLGFSLADEISKKMDINKHRKYITVDGKTIKIDDRDVL